MVDIRRLHLLVGMARFKQKNEEQSLRINRYFQGDYLTFSLIRNFFLTTIGYVLVLAIIAMYNMESLLSNLNNLNLRPLIAAVVLGYLVVLGIYSVIAYTQAKIRYVRAEADNKRYNRALVRMTKIYRAEQLEDDDQEEEE
jgi:hypothetical protein